MPKKHRGLRQLYGELIAEIRARKGVSIVFFTLRTIVLVTLVLQFLRGNYENVFLCLLTLLLFLIPAFINRRLNIQLPDTLEIIILCFIFAAEILGEINAYYVKYEFWDTMLHLSLIHIFLPFTCRQNYDIVFPSKIQVFFLSRHVKLS